MFYAVELYFDPQMEQAVLDLRSVLQAQGIRLPEELSADRPHISLGVFLDIDPDRLGPLVETYAKELEPFPVTLGAIGAFATAENVLYLSPVPTQQLLSVHQRFHDRLAQSGIVPLHYYAPGSWIPHCTVVIKIPADQFAPAVDLCKNAFRPVCGQVEQIGIVEGPPVRPVASWGV